MQFQRLVAAAILAGCLVACGPGQSQGASAGPDNPFVCNRMDARDVLKAMSSQGAQLSGVREAVFYFYGDEARLPALQTELEGMGFTVKPTLTEPGRIATTNVVTDEPWLEFIMPKLCTLAARHGVTYDGWEASLPEGRGRR